MGPSRTRSSLGVRPDPDQPLPSGSRVTVKEQQRIRGSKMIPGVAVLLFLVLLAAPIPQTSEPALAEGGGSDLQQAVSDSTQESEGVGRTIYMLTPSLKRGGFKHGVLSFCDDVFFMHVRETPYATREQAVHAADKDALVGSVAASFIVGGLATLLTHEHKGMVFAGASVLYFPIALGFSRGQLVEAIEPKTLVWHKSEWVDASEAGLVNYDGLWMEPRRAALIESERAAFEDAKHLNTVAAYDQYIARYQDSPFRGEAELCRARADSAAWRVALSGASRDSYNRYLAENPYGSYGGEALDSLEAYDWPIVRRTDTESAYRDYLEKYPRGFHRHLAQSRRLEIEDQIWRMADSIGSVASYSGYVNAYPQGRFIGDAKTRLEELLWTDAVKRDTREAWRRLLETLPDSRYAAEAQARIIALEQQAWASALERSMTEKSVTFVGLVSDIQCNIGFEVGKESASVGGGVESENIIVSFSFDGHPDVRFYMTGTEGLQHGLVVRTKHGYLNTDTPCEDCSWRVRVSARRSGVGGLTWRGKDKSYHVNSDPGESWYRVISFERVAE
jgi:hypothetical protein